MAAHHSLWGVGWSCIERECGMVVTKDMRSSMHILAAAIDVPNRASAGRCQVSVLLIVVSVELMVEILGRQ